MSAIPTYVRSISPVSNEVAANTTQCFGVWAMIWVLSCLRDAFVVHACVRVVFQASCVDVFDMYFISFGDPGWCHMMGKRAPKCKPRERQDEDKKTSPDVA